MKRDNQCDIQCPYYVTDGERYITCEGVYTEVIKQRFENEKEINIFQHRFCFKYPNQCQISRILDEKYQKS